MTPEVEAKLREKFEAWCGITITDESKAPKAAALRRAYWNAWQAAWRAAYNEGRRAQRDIDKQLVDKWWYAGKAQLIREIDEAEAIRRGGTDADH